MSDFGSHRTGLERFLNKLGLGIRGQLIVILLIEKIIPFVVLVILIWQQIGGLGAVLQEIAVNDSSDALDSSATENIERMTTDTAWRVAEFLYDRDDDLRYLASIEPTEENYRLFIDAQKGFLIDKGEWILSEDGSEWTQVNPPVVDDPGGISHNEENNDMDNFNYRKNTFFPTHEMSLYDEITFVDLNGQEIVKVNSIDSSKTRYPLATEKRNVSVKENTYIKAETYFSEVSKMKPGEIYVSDVIGAYVGMNYIGMYTPNNVLKAATERGYDIPFLPEEQAYSGMENPNGIRFEGIVRFATPVADEAGNIKGYVTFALNHDHLMEFVDHVTPMNERYTQVPSAYDGNYAFIWDYKCRSICHPRHHSIYGFDPETGEPEVPWLESSIYDAWQASGVESWSEFVKDWPLFDHQSRKKKPAPALTQAGLVGLDGRYLNNAPQCTGWMDLTETGGSGSFYILWSGLYKLTTAAAIPYYTGQYAPSEDNGYSRRGFGIVTIGAGLEDFTRPATETQIRLGEAIDENLEATSQKLIASLIAIAALMVLFAILISLMFTSNITRLIKGLFRFKSGERQFRFNDHTNDEFATLATSFDEMADSLAESVKNPLVITDMNHIVIYMNDYGLELCKKKLEEVVGTNYGLSSVYPPNTQYDPILALENNREAEIFCVEEGKLYTRGSASHFMDKDGRQLGYIIETVDVTEMVMENIKVEEQRALLDSIFSASPDLIWYLDGQGRYLAVNPRYADIVGAPVQDFVGRQPSEMLSTEKMEVFINNDKKALYATKPLYTTESIMFADGHREILDTVRMPLVDAENGFRTMLGFARNVDKRVQMETELRETQIELEQAVEDANKANAHKGDFLTRMSHEIRTPLNAVIGLTSIVEKRLSEEPVDEKTISQIKTHINQIEESSQHLLGLLNDILDISKIDAGKIELVMDTLSLSELVQTVGTIIKPKCIEKNITYSVKFEVDDPVTFKSDALRIRQVIINLLGNAVKFTPNNGRITLRVKRLERGKGKSLIRFAVIDTGIGIKKEAQQHIFSPFEQAEKDTSTHYGGTGLGLSISSSIVKMLGGRIHIQSEVNEGSTFYFDVWLDETDSHSLVLAGEEREEKFEGKRMLLVDDVEINRMIVAAMLEQTELVIDEAVDGQDAVNKFVASQPNTYDIILMDIRMPIVDGYQASNMIRSLDRPDAKTVPIIALTANAFKEDRDKAKEAGMNDHLSKPVDMQKLQQTLVMYLSEKT